MELINSSAQGRGISKRVALAIACVVALLAGMAMTAKAERASASNLYFCQMALVAKGNICAEGHYRKITRVNARAFNGSFCAGAYNSNWVQVGGWTCSGEVGETSNGNYDGSKFLNAAVLNNALGTTYVDYGLVYYNP